MAAAETPAYRRDSGAAPMAATEFRGSPYHVKLSGEKKRKRASGAETSIP